MNGFNKQILYNTGDLCSLQIIGYLNSYREDKISVCGYNNKKVICFESELQKITLNGNDAAPALVPAPVFGKSAPAPVS